MERLGLIGIHWRAGADLLERFTVAPDARAEILPRLREATGVSEMLYLATCNRVEILFADSGDTRLAEYRPRFFGALAGRSAEPGEAERTFRAWGGEGAAEHLLLVAAGLDSTQLGEHEIRGQLRDAHELSRELGLSGPRLDFVVEKAIRVARDVQQRTGLSEGRISIAEVGLDAVRERCVRHPGTVALVGVSAMTERCGDELHREGVPLIVVNRTPERARPLADRWQAPLFSLEEFRTDPVPLTALVSAVGTDRPVLGAAELGRLESVSDSPPLLVDFGLPSNADIDAAERLGLPCLDMNRINLEAERNRDRRRSEAVAARQLVDDALDDLRLAMAGRSVAPVLAALSRRYRETATEGVAKLFRRELKHLGEAEQQAVERFAQNLAKRLAHVPSVGLRALAGEYGAPALETFLEAADPELARELHRAVVREDLFTLDAPPKE